MSYLYAALGIQKSAILSIRENVVTTATGDSSCYVRWNGLSKWR